MEPETEGGVLDDSVIHEGQHPDAIAWEKSERRRDVRSRGDWNL
jgi:hypothetical protein